MAAALNFYRRLGVQIPDDADEQVHVEVQLPNGAASRLRHCADNQRLRPRLAGTRRRQPRTIAVRAASREAVDDLYNDLLAAGYTGHQAPFDAFWGSRYAVVNDPDGNLVGFPSPRDPGRGGPPPGM